MAKNKNRNTKGKAQKGNNLMSGALYNVYQYDDSSLPKTYQEFTENLNQEIPPARLSRGNVINKNGNVETHLIFDYCDKYNEESASFKLYLYEDGVASGKIEFPSEYNQPKQPFKGNYKMEKNGKIVIWGIWSLDDTFKKNFPVIIELDK